MKPSGNSREGSRRRVNQISAAIGKISDSTKWIHFSPNKALKLCRSRLTNDLHFLRNFYEESAIWNFAMIAASSFGLDKSPKAKYLANILYRTFGKDVSVFFLVQLFKLYPTTSKFLPWKSSWRISEYTRSNIFGWKRLVQKNYAVTHWNALTKWVLRLDWSYRVKTRPLFRYEGKTQKERSLLIFKDKCFINYIIKKKVSLRALYWYGSW